MKSVPLFIFIGILIQKSCCAMKKENDRLAVLAEVCGMRLPLTEAELALLMGNRKYQCNYEGCSKEFNKKHNCARHLRSIHHIVESQIKRCPVKSCALWFLSPVKLKKHIKEFHRFE